MSHRRGIKWHPVERDTTVFYIKPGQIMVCKALPLVVNYFVIHMVEYISQEIASHGICFYYRAATLQIIEEHNRLGSLCHLLLNLLKFRIGEINEFRQIKSS